MGDLMRPIPFKKLTNWMLQELEDSGSIFAVPREKFYQRKSEQSLEIFGSKLANPIGPAAGPNTQLAQNIVAAYLGGGRFMELKTVQILDKLEFPKPCIYAEDECYNTEWSTELAIEDALAEYIKGWFLLHVLEKELFNSDVPSFVFNMSVGYDLKGIQSPKVDAFIEGLKDASNTEIFRECKVVLKEMLPRFKNVDEAFIDSISPCICNSITLSTMHGCPPAEIEAISKYLIAEKNLHTFVKMNPTLLGYEYVRNTFDKMGYGYIQLKEESFTNDLQYDDGVAMLKRLIQWAKEHGKEFGVKLSNTLASPITRGELPGEEMYMSGRALYPLTINLARKLSNEFNGELRISYSGGADYFNLAKIVETGIWPITVATTLLKPGGYQRFNQLAAIAEEQKIKGMPAKIDLEKLNKLADEALVDPNYQKGKRTVASRKIDRRLPLLDCFVAPCTVGCPIEQDVPEYIRLVGEGRYEEAYRVIVSKNPLPFITGTICNHLCQTKCTRIDYDVTVMIRSQKLEAAEKGFDSFMSKLETPAKKSKTKAAVIGAGPSGLAMGYFLARAGMDVTVFDKRNKAGGTVEWVIPDFRIPREAIQKDIDLISRMGVKFELGVDPNFSVEELKKQGYEYIYLAIGAGKVQPLPIEGDKDKVQDAYRFLAQFVQDKTQLKLGKNVAVIGGGNTAMDTARAATRVDGVEKVTIVYRRTREYMPADREEITLALDEGVELLELLSPVSLQNGVLKCQKLQLGEPDESGRRKPVAIEGAFVELPVDTVLTATGEAIETELYAKNGIALDDRGYPKVNPDTLETNVENVFIGGDGLYGPKTVVEGIAHATKAANAILAKENLGPAMVDPATSFDPEKQDAEITAKKGVLREPEEAAEPERCLECNAVCNICVEVCPNRANFKVQVPSLGNKNQILHIDGMCNECGDCATFCPYQGAPYREKMTLYWLEEDFNNSANPGFMLVSGGDTPVFKVRLDGKVFTAKFDQEGKTQDIANSYIADLIWTTYKNYSYII